MIMLRGAVRRRAKALMTSALGARVQFQSLSEARRGLKHLEAARGPLTTVTKREIRSYAIEVLGSSSYAPWLSLYAAVTGEFRIGWLPDNYYKRVTGPQINGEYHHVARHRACNGIAFSSDVFPDIAYSVNGIFYDASYKVIPPAALNRFLQDRVEHVVFKADRSGWGQGLAFMQSADVTPEVLSGRGNGVLQARIAPHAFFERFGLAPLATFRLVTAIEATGTANVRGCYLKLGRAGGSHVMAEDQVRVAVDWRTGVMAEEGFLSNWQPVDRHPDSGHALGGHVIPCMDACARTVLDLHRQFTLPRLLCWDVAVDADDKVQVLEWEGGVVSFAEATQGPCFSDLGWDKLHTGASAS